MHKCGVISCHRELRRLNLGVPKKGCLADSCVMARESSVRPTVTRLGSTSVIRVERPKARAKRRCWQGI